MSLSYIIELFQNTLKYNKNLQITFVDFQKEYDSVSIKSIILIPTKPILIPNKNIE